MTNLIIEQLIKTDYKGNEKETIKNQITQNEKNKEKQNNETKKNQTQMGKNKENENNNGACNETIRFRVGAWNAGGLMRKLAALTRRIEELDLDFVFVSETQWEARNRDPPNCISNIRGKPGGILGRAHYGSMIIHHPARKLTGIEVLEVGLFGNYQVWRWKGTLFAGVYCPPTQPEGPAAYLGRIFSAIQNFRRVGEPVIMMGDFNARLDKETREIPRNLAAQCMFDLAEAQNLSVGMLSEGPEGQVYTFRRIQGKRIQETVIDHFIICQDTVIAHQLRADYHHNAAEDHVLIYGEFETITTYMMPIATPGPFWKTGRLMKKRDRELFKNHFLHNHNDTMEATINSRDIRDQESCDALYEEVVKIIMKNADEFLGRSNGRKPIVPHLSQEYAEANAAYEALSETIDVLTTQGRFVDKRLVQAVRSMEGAKDRLRTAAQGSIMDGFYRYVDGLDKSESCRLSRTLCRATRARLRSQTTLLSSTDAGLGESRGFFFGQFNKTANAIEYEMPEIPPPLDGKWPSNTFTTVSEEECHIALKQMATGKAPGASGISVEIIKYLGRAFANRLCAFFNKLIESGFIPTPWRQARIIPIPKVAGSRNIADYRPISLTEILRKVFERCLLPQLRNVVEPLDISQGGFRAERGTIETIASLNETILQYERREKKQPIIVFLDIKAAYDSVDHALLMRKLARRDCPRPLLRMVKELMVGVTSKIRINGRESETFEHRAGVLQGSIISPMLYSLYIDDLAEAIRETLPGLQRVFMYADDIAVVLHNEEEVNLLSPILEEHSRMNNFKFNPRKCEIMNAETVMTLYGEEVPACEQFKYLGCLMNKEGIDWSEHIARLEKKTVQMLNFFTSIGYNSGGFRERTRLTIFKTFVRPLWEYCMCIMPDVKKWLDRLEKLQHRCLSQMFSVSIKTSKATLCTLTGIPSVRQRWLELTAKWHWRLRSKDARHMATQARNASNGKFPKRRSCFAAIGKNSVLQHYDEERKNNERFSLKDAILAKRYEWLTQRRLDSAFANTLTVYPDCKPRLLYSLSKEDRKVARTATLWLLGKIPGKLRKCLACGMKECSWRHFEECLDLQMVREAFVGLECAEAGLQ